MVGSYQRARTVECSACIPSLLRSLYVLGASAVNYTFLLYCGGVEDAAETAQRKFKLHQSLTTTILYATRPT